MGSKDTHITTSKSGVALSDQGKCKGRYQGKDRIRELEGELVHKRFRLRIATPIAINQKMRDIHRGLGGASQKISS